MSTQLKTRISLLSMAILSGLAISAVSQAAITSNPTGSVKGRAPTITAPTVTYKDNNSNNLIDAGDTLEAVDGVFSDADQDVQSPSTYRWNDGTADRGTNAIYTIAAADLGKTITLYTVPHTDSTITDPADGVEVRGPDTRVVDGDTVISVKILGNPEVESVLTTEVKCITSCFMLSYQWQLEDGIGLGTYSDIPGVVGTDVKYVPVRTDQMRKIRVVVE